MKNSERKLKIWECSVLAAVCISLYAGTWAQARQNAISGRLVRLHVIAVSDDHEEQEIKLKVRDAVLAYLEPVLRDADSPREAKELLNENLRAVALAAGKASEGRKVSVSLCRECYPTKEYEGFTLPAGSYDSLKIVLGEGKGHNWWCIVFPPICLGAAQGEQVKEAMGSDYSMVSGAGDRELRFRMVEIWGELMNKLPKK